MIAVEAGAARHARLELAAGQSMLTAVTAEMARLGWESATLLILGGSMATALYHTSVLTPGGARWIDYGPAQAVADPAWLVMASATFGRGLDGSPALHCHAVLSGGGRVAGGHLAPDRSVIGRGGLVAHATSAAGAGFRVMRNASGFDLLTPAA